MLLQGVNFWSPKYLSNPPKKEVVSSVSQTLSRPTGPPFFVVARSMSSSSVSLSTSAFLCEDMPSQGEHDHDSAPQEAVPSPSVLEAEVPAAEEDPAEEDLSAEEDLAAVAAAGTASGPGFGLPSSKRSLSQVCISPFVSTFEIDLLLHDLLKFLGGAHHPRAMLRLCITCKAVRRLLADVCMHVKRYVLSFGPVMGMKPQRGVILDADLATRKLCVACVPCWRAFVDRCTSGDAEMVKYILEKLPPDDHVISWYTGKTALYHASDYGQVKVVRVLLDAGARVDIPDTFGVTALMRASKKGHRDVVRTLLQAGADVSLRANTDSEGLTIQGNEGFTSLMLAAKYGHADITRDLLVAGSKPDDATDDGTTALIIAADEGKAECVIALLEGGARVDAVDAFCRPALLYASMNGHLSAVRALIGRGADVAHKDVDGTTALMVSCNTGMVDVSLELIRSGADIHTTDNDGCTAVKMAVHAGRRDLVRAMVEEVGGDKIDLLSVLTWTIRVVSGAWRLRPELKLIFEDVVNAGADVNACLSRGGSPLMVACKCGNVEAVRSLLDAGADPHKTTDAGNRALFYAAREGFLECVTALIDAGAKVDFFTGNNLTALQISIYKGHIECARALMGAGADMHLPNASGKTASDYAKIMGFEKSINAEIVD